MTPAQRIFVAVALAATLGGCANNIPPGDGIDDGGQIIANTTMRLDSAKYNQTFTATRDILRDYGFILDRVDAQAGVITTQPKGSAGIATPWNKEQSTFAQELEDVGQRNKRVVRVEFIPVGAAGVSDPESVRDLRRYSGELELRTAVDVYRWYQSGWRLNTLSILDSSYTYDPQLAERNMITYGVADQQDPALAERVVFAVRERTDAPMPVPAVAPAPEPASATQQTQPVPEPVQVAPAPMPEPVIQPPQAPSAPAPAPEPTPQEPDWRKGDPIKKP